MNENQISYIEQSAVIPYRINNREIEILLITSMRQKKWIIPKGIIETNMTAKESAAKEALEEAGIRGEVLPPLMGTYTYQKWGKICRVQVFILKVENTYLYWAEANFRKRQWFKLEEAIEYIEPSEVKAMLINLRNYI